MTILAAALKLATIACRPLSLGVIGIRVVGSRLLAVELEHFRRQRDALRVPQTAVEVDDDAHFWGPLRRADGSQDPRPVCGFGQLAEERLHDNHCRQGPAEAVP